MRSLLILLRGIAQSLTLRQFCLSCGSTLLSFCSLFSHNSSRYNSPILDGNFTHIAQYDHDVPSTDLHIFQSQYKSNYR